MGTLPKNHFYTNPCLRVNFGDSLHSHVTIKQALDISDYSRIST